jgi:hypothetical protein
MDSPIVISDDLVVGHYRNKSDKKGDFKFFPGGQIASYAENLGDAIKYVECRKMRSVTQNPVIDCTQGNLISVGSDLTI